MLPLSAGPPCLRGRLSSNVSPPINQQLQVSRSIEYASVLMLALGVAGCSDVPRSEAIAPFTTDGCSLFPNRSLSWKKDWCDCCVAHDRAYWRGGTSDERLATDKAFKACVKEKTSSPVLAALMYAGVRLGGTPYLNTSFRWGYGWSFGRGYAPLAQGEAADASRREVEYLAAHQSFSCPN